MLQARNEERPAAAVAAELGIEPDQVARVYRDIDRKRHTTRYLHLPPLLVQPVSEVGPASHGETV